MRRPHAEGSATANAGASTVKASNKPTLVVMILAAIMLILSACSTPQQATGLDPAAPEVSDWDWTTVGYADPSPDSNVEFVGEESAEGVTVSGTGTDIFGVSDEFVFVYTELQDNGYLQARLDDFDAPGEWSKAGIMIRESLDPAARNVLVHISGSNGAVMQARSENGSNTQVIAWDPDRSASAEWLRLSRNNDEVVAELSSDGVSWTRFSSHRLATSGPVLIGFAVAANANSPAAAIATFSDLKVFAGQQPQPTPSPTPAPNPPAPTPTPTPSPDPGNPGADLGFDLPPATLFVSPQGNASNSGRSEIQPTTLRRAAEIARAGDVVYMRGGTYPVHVNFRQSGTESNPIIWASYPGEWAVLDGSSLTPGGAYDRVFVDNVRWNIFANFEVSHSPNQGILLSNSHDNRFISIITHGNHGSGMQLIDSSRNSIEHLITYDNFDRNNSYGQPGQDADGIGISSGDRNRIINCVSYYNSDDGVDLWKGTNSLVDGCISFSNGRGAYGNGNGFKLGGPVAASNSTVVRSIAFNNKAAGFHSNGAREVTVSNNTSFNNGSNNFVGTSTTTYRNNVSASGSASMNGGTGINNSWTLGISNIGFASTDPSNPAFLSLSSSSAAINAGVNAGLPYSGSAPDLGALQYPDTWATALDNPLFDMGRALSMIQ